MKKGYMLLFGMLLLTACSQNETETNSVAETSSTVETTTQFSESSSSEQSSETSTQSTEESRNEEENENYPYAVNLADFTQESLPDDKKTYQRDFTTNQENLPKEVSINMKDSDDFDKAIYISPSKGEDLAYPVTITSVPTEKITLIGDDGEKRDVEVSTEVKVEEEKENNDSLQIAGDTYYLFYNDEGTITLAARNFDENPGEEDLDSKNMVEYVQERPNSAEANEDEDTEESSEDKSEEDETKAEEYYDAINDAWQEASDYINSIDDPDVHVQSSEAAASQEADRLKMENPEDKEVIEESFQNVREDKW